MDGRNPLLHGGSKLEKAPWIPTRRAENSEEELRRRNWERRSLGVWIVPEV